MTPQILHITFTFQVSTAELIGICTPAAAAIADFPGLLWKLWILDETAAIAGGIYCFENDQRLQAYLDSPIMAGLRAHPGFHAIEIRRYGAIAPLTTLTRGPVPRPSTAGMSHGHHF